MENFNSYCIEKRALLNNIQKVKSYIGKAKLCAVVKANAYGLGVKNVCPIIDSMVDFYAVICVKEALNLRKLTNKDILILGASDLNYVNDCAKNNITIAISTLEEVDAINRTAKLPINVHLKINSGMNRFGIKKKCELKRILEAIKKCNKINITGVYTHFATKDEDIHFIEKQYNFFIDLVRLIKQPGLLIHCANSYVATTDKLKLCNMVRVGFSLYGKNYGNLGLENAVSIKAKILAINKLKKGESVGYDRTFIAPRSMKIAVVSMGYYDGFPRALSNNFGVLINGKFAKVIGRVCMDCFMIDISKIKHAEAGEEVTILGKSGKHEITLESIAQSANLSPYEALTNFKQTRMDVVIN